VSGRYSYVTTVTRRRRRHLVTRHLSQPVGSGSRAVGTTAGGHLSLTILGVRPSLTFKGTQIGSDIGGIPSGWFFAGAGLVLFLASCRGN
jgi:hypothetical protein